MSERWADWRKLRPANACQTEVSGGRFCGQPHVARIKARLAPDSASFLVCEAHRAEFAVYGYVTVNEGAPAPARIDGERS